MKTMKEKKINSIENWVSEVKERKSTMIMLSDQS
jgi:hypothetical protein